LVALTGGAIGAAGAFWLVRVMNVMVAQRLALPNALQVNSSVLLFAAGITAIAGLLAGLAPALAVSRPDLQRIIQGSGRGAARGWSGGLRSVLVIGEVALALVLLLGAGLLLRSMQKLLAVPMGFDAERVLTMRMRLQSQRYNRPGQSEEFVRLLLERVRSLPGVRSAAVANSLPLNNYNLGRTFSLEDGGAGGISTSPNDKPASAVLTVTPGYFATLGIPLIAGRGVQDSDAAESLAVALVNRAFARRFFGDENPVGRHLRFGGDPKLPLMTIVGMVGDTRHNGPEKEPEPELYVPFAQSPAVPIGLAIRSSTAPELLTAAVRREIHELDPDMPIVAVSTMATRLSDATDAQRVELLLVGFFAALATGLAALGVYGVIAYAVSQGTREIGVRLALGAAPGAVQRSVVGRGLRLAAMGVAFGLCAGYALTTSMASLLFETGTHDRLTFLGAGGILLATAVLASYWPARRAAHVDPVVALRCE
jgi:putative ABC transport system permease protein